MNFKGIILVILCGASSFAGAVFEGSKLKLSGLLEKRRKRSSSVRPCLPDIQETSEASLASAGRSKTSPLVLTLKLLEAIETEDFYFSIISSGNVKPGSSSVYFDFSGAESVETLGFEEVPKKDSGVTYVEQEEFQLPDKVELEKRLAAFGSSLRYALIKQFAGEVYGSLDLWSEVNSMCSIYCHDKQELNKKVLVQQILLILRQS